LEHIIAAHPAICSPKQRSKEQERIYKATNGIKKRKMVSLEDRQSPQDYVEGDVAIRKAWCEHVFSAEDRQTQI
jgi:hypothetical protein